MAPASDPLISLVGDPEDRAARVARGVARARTALQRRYDTTLELAWIGGPHAVLLHAGDQQALSRGSISLHLRHPEWVDDTLVDHWFDGIPVHVERPDRQHRHGTVSNETRRGDDARFAARVLHALSLADTCCLDVEIHGTNEPRVEFPHTPVLDAAHVVVAELWRASLVLDQPIGHPAVTHRLGRALSTILMALDDATIVSEIDGIISGADRLGIRTRRGDEEPLVDTVSRAAARSIEQLRDARVRTLVKPVGLRPVDVDATLDQLLAALPLPIAS